MREIIFSLLLLGTFSATAATKQIAHPDELKGMKLQAGDTVVLRNGAYNDVQIKLNGIGTAEQPIVFMAEEAGKVTIEGQSNLRIAGEYVEVHNLWFRNGYSPAGAVIEFRTGSKNWANHCRVTGCAIDYFNPPTRDMGYNWVLLYGRNNRFDHNNIVGKLNLEVTLAVILSEERDQQNGHRIDHNYFGVRPVFGSNGAETIRVGTSQQAHTSSNTVIEFNFFEQCNGEVEVVSIKSADNIIRNNTFVECQGVLALRHGNRNVVENNLFAGNGVPNTGGVRVVNEGHTIRNNVFYKLAGDRFFAALAIMNAVPNSLPNRYHWVRDVSIERNTFVDCPNILLCVGKDNERTLAPSEVTVSNNIFSNKSSDKIYEAFDKINGFTFTDNLVETSTGKFVQKGFTEQKLQTQNIGDLNIPVAPNAGSTFFNFTRRNITGAAWMEKNSSKPATTAAKIIPVAPGQNTLLDAIAQAEEGDVIELSSLGVYSNDNTVTITKTIGIRKAPSLREWPTLRFNGSKRAPIITIANGGSLIISGVGFSGEMTPGKAAPIAAIATTDGMISPYTLQVNNCEFYGFFESNFAAIRGMKNTFADSVVITNSFFHDMSAECISYAAEKDDVGKYSVETLRIDRCTFFRTLGSAVNLYRGGNDESTAGPNFYISRCVFEDVNNREQGSVLRLIGAQNADVRTCIFSNSGRGGASIRFDEMSWDKVSVSDCNLWNSGRIQSFWGKVAKGGITNLDPQFKDIEEYDFTPKNAKVKDLLK